MLLLELNAVFLTEYFQMNQLQASFVFVWRTISPSLVPGSVVSRPTLSRPGDKPTGRPADTRSGYLFHDFNPYFDAK